MINKRKIEIFIQNMLMLFLILCNYSVYFSLYPIQLYLACAILMIMVIFMNKNISIVKKDVYKIIFIITCIVILIFCGNGFTDLTFLVAFCFLLLSYLYIKSVIRKDGLNSILNSFVVCMFWICLISLFFYLFGSVLKMVNCSSIILSKDVGWGYYDYNNYFGVYVEGQYTQFFGQNFLRNIGLFDEAPLFSTLITIALYTNLFLINKKNKYSLVFIISIITTFSSSAIAIASLLLFIDFYKSHLKKRKVIFVAPILALFAIYIASIVLYDKLFTGNISGSIRTDDLLACFGSWMASPILGNGFMNIKALTPYREAWRIGNAGVSSGLGFVLSNGGILLGTVYLYPLLISIYKFFLNNKKEIYGFILLLNLILLIMITQYTVLTMFFLAMSWILIDEICPTIRFNC